MIFSAFTVALEEMTFFCDLSFLTQSQPLHKYFFLNNKI